MVLRTPFLATVIGLSFLAAPVSAITLSYDTDINGIAGKVFVDIDRNISPVVVEDPNIFNLEVGYYGPVNLRVSNGLINSSFTNIGTSLIYDFLSLDFGVFGSDLYFRFVDLDFSTLSSRNSDDVIQALISGNNLTVPSFSIAGDESIVVGGFTGDLNEVAAVPIPAAAFLLLSGLGGLTLLRRRGTFA